MTAYSTDAAVKVLVPTATLPNAVAAQYTNVPSLANSIVEVTALIFCNTDSAAHTITLHNVPSGGAAATGNKLFAACPIPANTTWIAAYNENGAFVMAAGGSIQAFADTAGVVTMTVSGKETV